jgi:hypothetical protein
MAKNKFRARCVKFKVDNNQIYSIFFLLLAQTNILTKS